MAVDHPNLRLASSNAPPSLDLVAAAIAGVADACALDALAGNDLATAVGELAKNVVLHAYDGAEGPLELEVRLREEAIEVTVRDEGIGIRPHLGERTQPHTGIGMPIVHLLSRRVTYTNLPGGGTEVCMELSTPGLEAAGAAALLEPATPLEPHAREVRLSLSPAGLSAPVLTRVLCALDGGSSREDRLADLAEDLAREAICDLALDLRLRPDQEGLTLHAAYLDLAAAERLLARHADLGSGVASLQRSRREGTAALTLCLQRPGAVPAS